jgi:hypothetical protein
MMQNQPKKSTRRSFFLIHAFIGLGTGKGALLNNVDMGTAIGAALSRVRSLIEERPR